MKDLISIASNYQSNKNKSGFLLIFIIFLQNIVFIRKGITKKYYYPNKPQNKIFDGIKRILSKFLIKF